ncbi:MAG: signal peptidase I [Candidatus Woesearchaeota archaeon]
MHGTIKTGTLTNARDPEGRGWFIGRFMEEPYATHAFEAKWATHEKGSRRTPSANDAKTMCILISGSFVLRFPDKNTETILNEQGAFVWWDANVLHTYEALEESTVLTIRWPSKNTNDTTPK